ncbi:Glycosyltransferase, catalytic subunit of cellulose synthase and poly-beta-1,6-N-acetylglucosamine synthase [Prosthecobacter debontii]|uniref:Glycosyltransferase, catalytic subunit of cellulose synthase and poly-beta-1,6-N-acetylglucosamine synthase n=1 Tax=Prosthecobacter debontii TaxID=48467 RepID=A0A1T4XAY6_9BACT|nr:glycosyltransferase [Prosthecobacter debontii]SKA86750.1 Glycosyltransferase, catalytic subunit of cellulose synthase and poly-beta-1,6-N-acetylglucosamine synthase [Prosthecobacter debontii]
MIQWEKLLWFTSYIIVSAGLSAFGAHKVKVLYTYWKHRKNRPQPLSRFTELPLITIQLPIFNEADVLGQLVNSISALDYPKDRLQIQFLDDSTDETTVACQRYVERMQQQGFEVEYRHRTNRQGFKAGALDAAMPTVKGEFICIFDADFQPESDYLNKTIHHFTDPQVGIVQARWGHNNRSFSLLTRLQAILLDGHLMLEQTSRSRQGEFCNFNGTAGLWRRRVIDEAGGWKHDTLTEDLDLSYRAQLLGWRFIYLNDVLVPAELPPDMDGFKSQQHRWTKGSVQVCKKVLGRVWRSDEPFMKKVEATAHLTSNFANLLTLCTLVLLYPVDFLPVNSWQKAVFIDLPVFLFATVAVIAFYLTAQGTQSRWGWLKTIPYIPLFMGLGIGMSINNGKAVIEALLGKESEFVRTPKYGVNSKAQASKKSFRYKAGKSLCLWIELALVGYFGHLLWLAIEKEQWGSLPFLALFLFGFLYVSLGSLLKRFSMDFFSTPPPPEQGPEEDTPEVVTA